MPDLKTDPFTVRDLPTPKLIKNSINYVRWQYFKKYPFRISAHAKFHKIGEMNNQAAYLNAVVNMEKLKMPGAARDEVKHTLEINLLKRLLPGVRCGRYANLQQVADAENAENAENAEDAEDENQNTDTGVELQEGEGADGFVIQPRQCPGEKDSHKEYILRRARESMGLVSEDSEVAAEVATEVNSVADPADLPSPTTFPDINPEYNMADNGTIMLPAPTESSQPRRTMPLKRGMHDAAPPEVERKKRPKPAKHRFGMDAVLADLAHAKRRPSRSASQRPTTNGAGRSIPESNLLDDLDANVERVVETRDMLSNQYEKLLDKTAHYAARSMLAESQTRKAVGNLEQLLRTIQTKTSPVITYHLCNRIRETIDEYELVLWGLSDLLDEIAPVGSFVKRKLPLEEDDDEDIPDDDDERPSKRSRMDTQPRPSLSPAPVIKESELINNGTSSIAPQPPSNNGRRRRDVSSKQSSVSPPSTKRKDSTVARTPRSSSTTYRKSPHPSKGKRLTSPKPGTSLAFLSRVQLPQVSYSDPLLSHHPRHNIVATTPLHTLEVGHSDPEYLSQLREDSPYREVRQDDRNRFITPRDRIFPLGHPPPAYDSPSPPASPTARSNADLPFTPARRRSTRGHLSLAGHNDPSPTPARLNYARPPARMDVRDDDDDDFTPSPIEEEDPNDEAEPEVDELEDDDDLAMSSHDDINDYAAAIYGSDDDDDFNHHSQAIHPPQSQRPSYYSNDAETDGGYDGAYDSELMDSAAPTHPSTSHPTLRPIGRLEGWGGLGNASSRPDASQGIPRPHFDGESLSDYSDDSEGEYDEDESYRRGGVITDIREASFS